MYLWDQHIPVAQYGKVSDVPAEKLQETYMAMKGEVDKWGQEAAEFDLSDYFNGRKRNHDGKDKVLVLQAIGCGL